MNNHIPVNGNNGKGTSPFGNEKVEYPVAFTLKAVMDATISDEENRKRITSVFYELDIVHTFKNKRLSSKGNYISFTYLVTLTAKKQLDDMYGKLKLVKGLKFAL
jgi:putative lipoic acid-binding regulatory protein